MFNRTLQVDVVKKSDKANMTPDKEDINFEAKTKILVKAVERGILKVGAIVCAYVVLDTARKVVVTSVEK